MLNEQIAEQLTEYKDESYGDFQWKLMPGVPRETIIGVRTPRLRGYAKHLASAQNSSYMDFFSELPHLFYEENNLHMYLLDYISDYETFIWELNRFLPFIDNWATCDAQSFSMIQAHVGEFYPNVIAYLSDERTYIRRFGIGCLLKYYLENAFSAEHLELAAAAQVNIEEPINHSVNPDAYYVNMMVAWYMATALAVHWDDAIVYLTQHKLSPWVHRKTIQKAIESHRITDEQKRYLKNLRVNSTTHRVSWNVSNHHNKLIDIL